MLFIEENKDIISESYFLFKHIPTKTYHNLYYSIKNCDIYTFAGYNVSKTNIINNI